jgi:hypothetical protein
MCRTRGLLHLLSFFVATSALDQLFGDYIDLRKLPENVLDWVGTHLWKDVAVLQGPAASVPVCVINLQSDFVITNYGCQ